MSTFAAGSLTQLVAKGALDMYLSTNPEATFWKSGFSRCTAFSMEAIVQDFTGGAGVGGMQSLELNRTGDCYTLSNLTATVRHQHDCGDGVTLTRFQCPRTSLRAGAVTMTRAH